MSELRTRAVEKLRHALTVGLATADNRDYLIPDARLTVDEAHALLGVDPATVPEVISPSEVQLFRQHAEED